MIEFIKNIFSSSVIKSEIMKVLNTRIAKAESDFKTGIAVIGEQLKADLESAQEVAKLNEGQLVKTLIQEVIGDLVN